MSSDIFHASVLADGFLPAAKATLYTAPAGKRVIIKTISIVNTDSADRTVNLYINGNGTSRLIIPKDMTLQPQHLGVDDENHTLYDGDLVEGDASVAGVVSYLIEGAVSE